MSKTVILLLSAMLVLVSAAHAQNSNNFMSVISNTALNWSINTETEIQNDQSIAAAITLQVKNRSNPPTTRSVYVRCSAINGPAGFTIPSVPLKLDYTSDNSSNESNLITTALTITTTDQRLFTHSAHASNSTYSFNYDLIHTATNWAFPPGTYNYTLTFTFVNP